MEHQPNYANGRNWHKSTPAVDSVKLHLRWLTTVFRRKKDFQICEIKVILSKKNKCKSGENAKFSDRASGGGDWKLVILKFFSQNLA